MPDSITSPPFPAPGVRFNRFTVVEYSGIRNRRRVWKCRCDCGAIRFVNTKELRLGRTKSCGCYNAEAARERNFKHGMNRTPEYFVWQAMRERCFDPNYAGYPNYGGRGITICERWSEFLSFLADMGPRPSEKHSIDRIDNDGPYSPENCRWATRKEQCRNTRRNIWVTFDGETLTLAEWAERTGIKYNTLFYRVVTARWPLERAMRLKGGA